MRLGRGRVAPERIRSVRVCGGGRWGRRHLRRHPAACCFADDVRLPIPTLSVSPRVGVHVRVGVHTADFLAARGARVRPARRRRSAPLVVLRMPQAPSRARPAGSVRALPRPPALCGAPGCSPPRLLGVGRDVGALGERLAGCPVPLRPPLTALPPRLFPLAPRRFGLRRRRRRWRSPRNKTGAGGFALLGAEPHSGGRPLLLLLRLVVRPPDR